MVKKKDVISEVDDKVKELIDLMVLDKTMQCDAGKNDYTRCVLRKAMVHVELRKRLDKLIYELAFGYVTTEIIDEKEMIEQVVNHFVEVGLINEDRWMKAVQNALRYVNRIDGMDARVKVRRVAEEMDKIFEEEGFR
jgi:hypothetical protein